uniref:Histone H2A n=1 Tax=Timema cristinae TaxID=61476 RepID=A0A7R9HCS6_TIMCR|nr:unnamed protein product [Timema cristinae]
MAESIICLGRATTERVGVGALVYLTALMEYLVANVLELAGNETRDNKKTRIICNWIFTMTRNSTNFSDMTIA